MISSEGDFCVKFLESSRYSPRVWILVFVVQRLDLLLFLLLAEFRGVAEAEKIWGKLDQPLWINGRDFSHVFLGRQNEFMVDNPVGLSVEEGARGVDVDHLTVNECPIPFLGVLLGGVTEKPTTDGLLNSCSVLTTADDIQLVPVHNTQHLFADILGPFESSNLHKVFVAPGAGELVVLPRVVHGQQRDVVALRLVELGLLLVR